MTEKQRPVKVEVVRVFEPNEWAVRVLAGLALVALIALALDAFLANLFPDFDINYWQCVAAVLLARLIFGFPWMPRSEIK